MATRAVPHSVRPTEERQVSSEPVRPAVPAVDLDPARPFVAAARMVQVLPQAAVAQPLVGPEEAVMAQRLERPAAWDVAAAVAQEAPRVA